MLYWTWLIDPLANWPDRPKVGQWVNGSVRQVHYTSYSRHLTADIRNPPRLRVIFLQSERETQLTLEDTVAGTTLPRGSSEVRTLNAERGLVPIRMVQYVCGIDAELKGLVLADTERLAHVGIECLTPRQL